MTVSTSKILDAYKAMHTKKPAKVIVEAEDPKAEEKKEDKKPGKATKMGLYTDFTGSIRTGGVSGEVKDATFTIDSNGHVEFKDGIWLNGTWSDRSSSFHKGTWKDGVWKAGIWYGGTWENGRHENGIFQGGVWKNGTWEFGVFDSDFVSPKQQEQGNKATTWEDGVWKGGDFDKNAVWVKGRDVKGVEHTDAPFHWGGMKYSKVTDPTKADAKRANDPRYKEAFTKSDDPRKMDTFDDEADKNLLAKAVEKGAGRVPDITESIKISKCVRKYLTGTKILGSMLINEADYTQKQEEAFAKIKAMIVDKDNTTDTPATSADAAKTEEPIKTDEETAKNTTPEGKELGPEDKAVLEAKKTKEDIKKLELNDEICTELEDATVENLEAVKQFILDGFKCLTDEEREDLANAEHEKTETPEEEAKERATGKEDEQVKKELLVQL